MKTTTACEHPPRRSVTSLGVPCTDGPRVAALSVEVRHEAIAPDREDELRRLACLQRLAHLQKRVEDLHALRERVLRAASAKLC